MGMMSFKDDEPKYCAECGAIITAGSDYLKYFSAEFCSRECLGENMVKEAEDNNEIEVEHIKSAEDKMDEWADRECHRRKEEE